MFMSTTIILIHKSISPSPSLVPSDLHLPLKTVQLICTRSVPHTITRITQTHNSINCKAAIRSSSPPLKSDWPPSTMTDPSAANSITHVIFDMDGLLLDTEKFYTEVQEMILARYNKTFDWSLKAKMMGMKAIEAAKVFVQETGISDSLSAEDFLVEREDMLQKLFPTSDLMPGASRLIKHLHMSNIPICVATGSKKYHYELKTQRHGEVFSLMHHIVNGDDPEVKQGKPAPDIFLVAAKRFEGGPIDPQKVLVFEDAPSGVLAAKNAGMSVVMVPDPRLDSSYHETADKVLKSLLDFQPADWGLPSFVDAI